MKENDVKVPSLKDRRRYETQKAQREAAKAGMVHPRRLARSMAKAYCRAKGIKESHCGGYFRALAKQLSRVGRKYLLSDVERATRSGRRIVRKA
jgi:hypothetical protein